MAATQETLAKALGKDSPFNEGEQSLLEWQYRLSGDFTMKLWECIAKADEGNLALLARAFPRHIAAYLSWTRDSGPDALWRRFQEAGVRP